MWINKKRLDKSKYSLNKSTQFTPRRFHNYEYFELNLAQSEVKVNSLSPVRLFATPLTVAHQAPPSMVFSRQEYWSGLPFPSPGDLPNPGLPHCGQTLYCLSHQGIPKIQPKLPTNLTTASKSGKSFTQYLKYRRQKFKITRHYRGSTGSE